MTYDIKMDKDKIKEIVKQQFTEYLTRKKCRKTPERYAILDLIYTETGHFNVDSLYDSMNAKNFRVSRATLYNTMQLLLDCHLVQKHQFGTNLSHYECTYNNDYHNHLICMDCGQVEEYKDNDLKTYIQTKKIKKFTPVHYGLYIYGICSKCLIKRKRENKANNNKPGHK
jgi:Fur family ferric uptake transcriptional regulator